ncbi:MAG: hypothetical protein NTZ05_14775 [Chloroflexi bacterium]|nr:hypothetical protein [Chloroflexota bacterium]
MQLLSGGANQGAIVVEPQQRQRRIAEDGVLEGSAAGASQQRSEAEGGMFGPHRAADRGAGEAPRPIYQPERKRTRLTAVARRSGAAAVRGAAVGHPGVPFARNEHE